MVGSRTAHFIQKRTGPAAPAYAPADTIGISETGLLAVERLAQLVDEYFSFWTSQRGRCSDVLTAWLVELRAVVADGVAQLWKERGDWFERVCRAKLDVNLTPIVDQSRRAAREIEINDLGPENIPFEQIMAQAREAIEQSSKLLAGAQGERVQSEPVPRAPPPNEVVQPKHKMQDAVSDGREASTPAPRKRTRHFREPNLELLKNQEGTLNRKNAAEALGVTERTLDRWVADKQIIPVGPGFRKRFKNKDLLRFFNKQNRGQSRQE
jgi:hypothetical protein